MLAADPHHFGDTLGHDHFQGVEPAENVQFPDPAIDRSALRYVQLIPPHQVNWWWVDR